jgi:hypothetical protein
MVRKGKNKKGIRSSGETDFNAVITKNFFDEYMIFLKKGKSASITDAVYEVHRLKFYTYESIHEITHGDFELRRIGLRNSKGIKREIEKGNLKALSDEELRDLSNFLLGEKNVKEFKFPYVPVYEIKAFKTLN